MRPAAHLMFAAAACVLAFIGYAAAYGAVSAKSAAVAVLQSRIDVHTATVSRLSSARASLAELATDESALEGYFIPQSRIVPFIDGLQAVGRSLGTAIKVGSVATGGTPARPNLALSLVVTGPFDGVMRTIGSIEHGPYAVSVAKLTVTALEKGSWQGNMDILVGSRNDQPPKP